MKLNGFDVFGGASWDKICSIVTGAVPYNSYTLSAPTSDYFTWDEPKWKLGIFSPVRGAASVTCPRL
jgi:hypothetical protein